MKTIFKKISASLVLACLAFSMTSCSFISKAAKDFDGKENERISKILNDKAPEYGIDAASAEVKQGGQYFKVLIGSPNTLDKLKDLAVLHRRWQRFCFAECKNRKFSVTFYDKGHPDIPYSGFSDQDQGFNAELYYDDHTIFLKFVNQIRLYTSPDYKKAKWTPEEFYQMTGISGEIAEEYWTWFHEQFNSRKDERPDPADHDITFIPGDNIMHREKFVIGDEKCPIPAGTYMVDVTQKHGVIHVTDSEGGFKYRVDGDYRDGHSDALYEYSSMPAKIVLNEGDIVYMTNCASTFDKASGDDA